jgi:hypothetical protein
VAEWKFQQGTTGLSDVRSSVWSCFISQLLCNFPLRQTVIDNKSQDTIEGETILQNFYVDDMLKSSDDTRSAIQTISNVQKLCSSGGFNLTKFVCEESEVMESIPSAKCSSEAIKEISKTETIERAL